MRGETKCVEKLPRRRAPAFRRFDLFRREPAGAQGVGHEGARQCDADGAADTRGGNGHAGGRADLIARYRAHDRALIGRIE